MSKDISLVRMVDEAVTGRQDSAETLFMMVAGRVRARLDPDEADVVAGWFERLAAGEDPRTIFYYGRGGRPKGKTEPRKPMPDGREPDDWDIAFIVHQNMKRRKGLKPRPRVAEIYKGVAKAFGMEVPNVRNIYSRLKKELPDL